MPTPKRKRDLEKHYSVAEYAAELRRLADTLDGLHPSLENAPQCPRIAGR